jgi:hypothetical protein
MSTAHRQLIAIAVVAVLVVLLAVVMPTTEVGGAPESAVATASRPSAPKPRAENLERVTAKSSGTNPFTPSVALDAPSPTSTTTAPNAIVTGEQIAASGLTTQVGSSPGLYGGTRNVASCDPEQLIAFLAANPDKARAWAAVEGIAPADIPAYIRSLTPVLLRADTSVINHGFANGVATPVPSVLQAGTAVLVDVYGIPRVRCYCGNPLLPPEPWTPTYTGPSWPGFEPAGVVIVVPAGTPVTVIQLVDFGTGRPFDRPVGTTGARDTDARTPTSTTTIAPSGRPPARGPDGIFATTSGEGVFSGSQELATPAQCVDAANAGATENLAVLVRGRTIRISDLGDLALEGTYDPDTGSFTASRSMPPPSAGTTETHTMTGIFDGEDRLVATLTLVVDPPTASCAIPLDGVRL